MASTAPPKLIISAEMLLRDPHELTEFMQEWVDSVKVKHWLREESLRRMSDPFRPATEQDRNRWQAFSSPPPQP